MSKRINVNYRKICQEHYGYTNSEMEGMDVHHIDGNRNNNDPSNLQLISPKNHADLHGSEFVEWARIGSKLGNEAFVKRLREHGQTDKELAHQRKLAKLREKGLHRVPHSEETKKVISLKKKNHLIDKTNHPMWGNTEYEVISPEGEKFNVSGGWKEWCFSRGLNPSNMRKVALGERKSCKGWKAKIIND